MVGVCDEANGQILLYVDGHCQSPPCAAVPASSTRPRSTLIGARDNGASLLGGINSMDSSMMRRFITTLLIPARSWLSTISLAFPLLYSATSGINVNAGSTRWFPPPWPGTTPLRMQWFDGVPTLLPGQTNSTLAVPNISASDTYYLTASNTIAGTGYPTNSVEVSVTVYNGIPNIYTDVHNPFYALTGQTANNSAPVYGESPLAYQWQFFSVTGWVNVTDNACISGSQGFRSKRRQCAERRSGNYQLVITNIYGATTSSVATLTIPGVLPLGFGNGLGWSAIGGATFSGGVLTLTTAVPSVQRTTSSRFRIHRRL